MIFRELSSRKITPYSLPIPHLPNRVNLLRRSRGWEEVGGRFRFRFSWVGSFAAKEFGRAYLRGAYLRRRYAWEERSLGERISGGAQLGESSPLPKENSQLRSSWEAGGLVG